MCSEPCARLATSTIKDRLLLEPSQRSYREIVGEVGGVPRHINAGLCGDYSGHFLLANLDPRRRALQREHCLHRHDELHRLRMKFSDCQVRMCPQHEYVTALSTNSLPSYSLRRVSSIASSFVP